jgi:hypothetical protein
MEEAAAEAVVRVAVYRSVPESFQEAAGEIPLIPEYLEEVVEEVVGVAAAQVEGPEVALATLAMARFRLMSTRIQDGGYRLLPERLVLRTERQRSPSTPTI